MHLSELCRYCGFCGVAFEDGDDLTVIVADNTYDLDNTHIQSAAVTVHRKCSVTIQAAQRDEMLYRE